MTIQQPGPVVTQGQRPVVIQEQPPVVIQEQRTVATTTSPGNNEFARRIVVFVFGIVQAVIILRIVFLLLDARESNALVFSGPEHQPGLRRPVRGAPAHQRPDLGWRCPRHRRDRRAHRLDDPRIARHCGDRNLSAASPRERGPRDRRPFDEGNRFDRVGGPIDRPSGRHGPGRAAQGRPRDGDHVRRPRRRDDHEHRSDDHHR